MCLDSYAHGMRVNHEIFQTPYPVKLTIEERPTPVEYQLRTAEELPKTMPMWRVQTEGYTDGGDQLIGVVSQAKGYADSPDVEWISSGVNTKAIDAVALGRHGNFFHWGFAVSPTYMTGEAKLVLINALYYIAKFDGQPPLARKQRGVISRVELHSYLDEISDAGYARKVARYGHMAAEDEAMKQAIRDRIAAGEDVGEDDRRFVSFPPPEPPDRLQSLERLIAKADWPAAQDDPAEIRATLTAELPYVRYAGNWYELEVDHELMALGIPNNDLALLGWAVAALASGDRADLAATLLTRYTDQTFDTAAEWSAWLSANREQLFFTDAGGYKWLSSLRPTATAKAPKATPEATAGAATSEPREPSRMEPLTAGLSAARTDEATVRVTLAVRILRGWHAYDDVPKGEPYAALAPSLELPDGTLLEADWSRPASRPDRGNPRMTLFQGDLEFVVELPEQVLENNRALVCSLRYQVCDEDLCMPPTTERLTIQLPSVSEVVDPPTQGSTQPR